MKTTRYGWLPAFCAVLLLMIPLGLKPTLAQKKDSMEAPTPPVELSNITFQFAVLDSSGQLKWETPNPKTPNEIPAGTQKLKFTAKVNNRPAGSTIRVKAALQEVCASPDAGKPFLARLRHLTENEQDLEISKTGQIVIELIVHCEECVHATCGKECPDKDHLGEGPHATTLTVSDPPTGKNIMAAKPASFRMDVRSVCPKKS